MLRRTLWFTRKQGVGPVTLSDWIHTKERTESTSLWVETPEDYSNHRRTVHLSKVRTKMECENDLLMFTSQNKNGNEREGHEIGHVDIVPVHYQEFGRVFKQLSRSLLRLAAGIFRLSRHIPQSCLTHPDSECQGRRFPKTTPKLDPEWSRFIIF